MVFIGLIIGVIVIFRIVDKCFYMFICFILLVYFYVMVNYVGYWMVKNVYLNEVVVGYSILNVIFLIIMFIFGFIIMIVVI